MKVNQETTDVAHFINSLEKVRQALNNATDANQAVENILEVVSSIFNCDRIWLFHPCDPDAPTFRVLAEQNKPEYPGAFVAGQELPITADAAVTIRNALSLRSPVTFGPDSENKVDDVATQFSVQSQLLMAVHPMTGEPWMFGMHQCSHPRIWTKHEQLLFKEISYRIVDVLNNMILLEELREKTRFLDSVIEFSALSLWISDEKGTAIRANPACLEFFGATEEEVIGKYNLFEDIIIKNAGFMPVVKSVFENGDVAEFVIDYDFKLVDHVHVEDGTHSIIKAILTPILGNDGNVTNVIIQTVDLTNIKRAEEELLDSKNSLDMAQEVSRTGSWNWNIIADTLSWSDETYRLFGLKPQEIEATYSLFERFIHPDDLALINERVKKALDGDRPYSVNARMFRIDGSEWIMHAQGKITRDKEGNAVRFVGTQQDITEQKKAEEENIKLNERLQQAQKMEAIGTLAGGIAHDFNNILAAILGYAEMAKDDVPPDSIVAKDLDKVLEGGNRAKDLVQQILAFSRQNEMERIPLQPESVVKKAIRMLRPSLPTTIEINQDITSATGLILADPTQIHQIVMNLCTNAFHAMEETGGKLGISLKEKTLNTEDLAHEPDVEAGTFVQLSISDSGPGIAPDIKKKIFDPYFTTKETGKGTGMGLSIVHGIVKSYGGFISLYSKPGEGTVFHVFLPVIEKELLPEIKVAEPIPIGRERILFIDDEEILAEMGKSMLERLGYHVTVRNNSIEALETFKNQPDLFDLVITDQTMPGMTGADIARRMIQIRPDIPIILCTGYSTVISEEKAKSMGIKEFALKPLTKKDLAVLIRKVLDN